MQLFVTFCWSFGIQRTLKDILLISGHSGFRLKLFPETVKVLLYCGALKDNKLGFTDQPQSELICLHDWHSCVFQVEDPLPSLSLQINAPVLSLSLSVLLLVAAVFLFLAFKRTSQSFGSRDFTLIFLNCFSENELFDFCQSQRLDNL